MTQIPVRSTSEDSPRNADLTPHPAVTMVPANEDSGMRSRSGFWKGLGAIRSSTLSRQLLTTVLPLSLAPLAVASIAGYAITQNRAQSQINTQLEGQTLLTSAGVSDVIEQELETLESLAISPFIQNLAEAAADVAEQADLPEESVEALETRFSADKQVNSNQALNNYFIQLAETEGFAELLLTERHGFMVGYNRTPSTFVQYRDTWWQQGRAQSEWISDPETDESVGAFGVSLSQRIGDPDTDEFLGVLKGFVSSSSFDFLTRYLQDAGITGSQRVQLLDVSSGFTLATFSEEGAAVPVDTSDALQVIGGRTVGEVAAQVIEAVQGVQGTSVEDLTSRLQGIESVRNLQVRQLPGDEAGQGFVISFGFDDKHYALSTVPNLDWVAIASMDIAEIRAQGRGLLGVFSLIAALLGGVAAVITVGLSNRLSSPLNDLSEKAQQVSAGDLNVMADPKGTVETQNLAQTFNELVQRVKGFLGEQTLNAQKAKLFADITGANVVTSAELSGLFSQVLTEARAILGADRVVVYQFGQNWQGFVAAESVAEKFPRALEQGLNDACIPEETREKYLADEVLRVDDVFSEEFHPEHLQLLNDLNVRSILAVPIKAQGQLYGLVIAHHCQSRYRWPEADVSFLQQLGGQVGLVIDRIQLLETTEALAEEQRQIKEGLQQNALQLLMDVDPVSRGDLTVRAKVTEDEIGTIADSYNATISSLRKIVGQVKSAAEQVVATTSTSDQSVRQLSTSALQQAQEIESALNQAQAMASSVRQVASNAREAELAVQQAASTVESGDQAMNRTVDGIMAIRETVAETAKKVKRLGESSQKISNVVNLISGFAAQTNMLALNASIEASRAGEGGKGFAVVAEEVRELARQSAEATTEIEKLVASIQTETNDVVLAMEVGTKQVVDGTELVDETRESLNRITTASEKISTLVEAITQATELQTKASEAVTASMTSVATIANQNSQEANQVSTSFEQLNTVAQTLQEEVDRFKLA